MLKRIILILFITLFLVLTIGSSVYFFLQWQKAQKQLIGTTAIEADKIVALAGKHILLPAGEIPTVFTVTEKDKLSGQNFFANAKNGDKVLVFYTAKKAFLYDPDRDLILEVGPVTATGSANTPISETNVEGVEDASPSAATTTPATVPIRFALYNGTSIAGVTKQYEAELVQDVPEAQIMERSNALKRDYEKSLLVYLGTGAPEMASKVAQALEMELESLPAGEVKPAGVDFLIIVGSDKR